MAHQSLYRRYRPRRFSEVRGQDHVIGALRNAVATGTTGHGYLFSGPRGTGKTTTARLLAKVLNCTDLRGGEPCCECDSCLAVEAGRSFDLFELDAASNRGIDNVRELIASTAIGSPGRTKVYILDEVHQLTDPASAALLKTLEEPPVGVVFVLATTDPQKVLPTIRSRTQHYEFRLLSADELEAYVRWVVADAGLDVDDASVAHVVRQGRGSARDTLSALDQVVAAGGVVERPQPVEELLGALEQGDTGTAITAVAEALRQGSEPRILADAFVGALRDTFLVSLGVPVPHLVDTDRERFANWAGRIGTARLTAAMEAVGSAMVDMRQAADPRVPLEVALVRLTATGEQSLDGLTRRVEQLEAALAGGGAPATAAAASSQAPARRPAATAAPPPATAPPAAPVAAPAPRRPAAAPAAPPAPARSTASPARSTGPARAAGGGCIGAFPPGSDREPGAGRAGGRSAGPAPVGALVRVAGSCGRDTGRPGRGHGSRPRRPDPRLRRLGDPPAQGRRQGDLLHGPLRDGDRQGRRLRAGERPGP